MLSIQSLCNKQRNTSASAGLQDAHTSPYGLSRRRRPQFWALVHASADVTPRPPRNALVRRRRSNNCLQRGHTNRTEAGWGFTALSAFFVPDDLDLWPPKGEKTCPDSRSTCPDSRPTIPTCMQKFTPLAFSAAEKSVTVQNDKQTKKQTNKITHSKLLVSTPAYYRMVGVRIQYFSR